MQFTKGKMLYVFSYMIYTAIFIETEGIPLLYNLKSAFYIRLTNLKEGSMPITTTTKHHICVTYLMTA